MTRPSDGMGELNLLDPDFLADPYPVYHRLRAEDPVHHIGGVPIPAGSLVLGLLGAANRDPSQFAEPDRLDLGRAEPHHLGFGSGIHYCLGASLARLEAQVAIGTVLRRFPSLAVAVESPIWRPSSALRGLEALPVVFGPTRA